MTKKRVVRNFWRENGNSFLKKRNSEISVCEIFFRPPKLGARSPPMHLRVSRSVCLLVDQSRMPIYPPLVLCIRISLYQLP